MYFVPEIVLYCIVFGTEVIWNTNPEEQKDDFQIKYFDNRLKKKYAVVLSVSKSSHLISLVDIHFN